MASKQIDVVHLKGTGTAESSRGRGSLLRKHVVQIFEEASLVGKVEEIACRFVSKYISCVLIL